MHHWAIVKAHLYIRFQFYLKSLSEAMYMWSVLQLNKTCRAVSVVIWIWFEANRIAERDLQGKKLRRFSCSDITSDHMTKLVGKLRNLMSDHRLLLPALLQDGTLISIQTFKWPTVFIKDRFFFFQNPVFCLKKIEARRFRTIIFLWPCHSLPDPVIPTNNEPSLTCPRLWRSARVRVYQASTAMLAVCIHGLGKTVNISSSLWKHSQLWANLYRHATFELNLHLQQNK